MPTTRDESSITPQMRHYAATKARDHFGFAGLRAAMACLYARPEGTTQSEINKAAKSLGSKQSGYYNMLRLAQGWNHNVVVWDDSLRGGKVFKLVYNPSHSGPRGDSPPANWREMNVPKAPSDVSPTLYPPRQRRKESSV